MNRECHAGGHIEIDIAGDASREAVDLNASGGPVEYRRSRNATSEGMEKVFHRIRALVVPQQDRRLTVRIRKRLSS